MSSWFRSPMPKWKTTHIMKTTRMSVYNISFKLCFFTCFFSQKMFWGRSAGLNFGLKPPMLPLFRFDPQQQQQNYSYHLFELKMRASSWPSIWLKVIIACTTLVNSLWLISSFRSSLIFFSYSFWSFSLSISIAVPYFFKCSIIFLFLNARWISAI